MFVIAGATCAVAQTENRPPSGAVFSGVGGASAASQNLNVKLDLSEAYERDVLAGPGNDASSVSHGGGLYTTLAPELDFQAGGRVQLRVSAASNERYYGDLNKVVAMSHSLGIGLRAQLTRRTSISFSPSVAYSPALFSGLLAGIDVPAVGTSLTNSNYAVDNNHSYDYSVAANLTHQLTDRLAAVFDSSVRYTDFTGHEAGYPDVRSEDLGGRVTYSLHRNVGLRLGYSFRHGQYSGFPDSRGHNLDIGIDYRRPLSRTRKTTISFSIGPVVADGALPSSPTQSVRQYQAVVDATLGHQIGRTWNVQAAYRRGLGYYDGFQSPAFTGAYTASVGGFLNRRTDLNMSAAYSSGESILNASLSQFTTYSADARIRVAINRNWATYLEYLLYDYRFGQTTQLPVAAAQGLSRNSVRTGLTMWIPVRHR